MKQRPESNSEQIVLDIAHSIISLHNAKLVFQKRENITFEDDESISLEFFIANAPLDTVIKMNIELSYKTVAAQAQLHSKARSLFAHMASSFPHNKKTTPIVPLFILYEIETYGSILLSPDAISEEILLQNQLCIYLENVSDNVLSYIARNKSGSTIKGKINKGNTENNISNMNFDLLASIIRKSSSTIKILPTELSNLHVQHAIDELLNVITRTMYANEEALSHEAKHEMSPRGGLPPCQ